MAETLRLARILVWNTIAGLLILLAANWLLPMGWWFPWWALALSAIGGVPGAILAILLKLIVLG